MRVPVENLAQISWGAHDAGVTLTVADDGRGIAELPAQIGATAAPMP